MLEFGQRPLVANQLLFGSFIHQLQRLDQLELLLDIAARLLTLELVLFDLARFVLLITVPVFLSLTASDPTRSDASTVDARSSF